MEWLEHQRRQQVEKRREASNAVDALLGLGWTSENFADVASGLKKKEQASGAQPLRKIITKSNHQG
jgi:Holliday junction resolvasome RuvABC DNA-binding subunit